MITVMPLIRQLINSDPEATDEEKQTLIRRLTPQGPDDCLTIPDACKLLHVTRQTFDRIIKEQKLHLIRISPRKTFISRSELDNIGIPTAEPDQKAE